MANFDIINFIQTNFEIIWPSVTSVAGAIISAIFFRKKNQIETGTQEFEMVKAGQFKEVTEELLKTGKLSYTEYYKMGNFLEIAKRADAVFKEETADTGENSIPPQNFDWHTRFFETCGNVSDEDMQKIWARILAGEIRKPGSYSMRTLECLRNLSKEEAMLFLKICEASIQIGRNVALPRIDSYLDQKKITYDEIIRLEDCGLIKADASIQTTLGVTKEYRILTHSDAWVLLTKKKEEATKKGTHRLAIDEYLFSQSGAELFTVIGINGNRDFIDICDLFRKQFTDFDFERGQIISRSGNQIQYLILKVEENKG